MYQWLHRIWYEGGSLYWVLLPLSGIYWLLIGIRRFFYRIGLRRSYRASVPVIVVGNITAGGTGKTPVTIWLARELRERGFVPGIVSRGYGGSRSGTSMRVDAASDPREVGDEPVLIASRTGCPVVVDADRARAADMLIAEGVNVIIADDGLQHYRLDRSYEICVIDGARGLGNRQLLPAGPLRETIDRLCEVDQVLINGRLDEESSDLTTVEQNAIEFRLAANEISRLNGSLIRPVAGFSGTTVHAVAAIGNPQRFFAMLRSHGMQVVEHAFRDHAQLGPKDLEFGDEFDVLMTEKDAVKINRTMPDKYWTVPVDLHIEAVVAGPWIEQVVSRLRSEMESP